MSVSDIPQVSPSQIDVPFTANKSQSLEETFSFLLSQFDATEEGGWGTLSIATTLALALAKPDWIKDPENHTAKMVLKHAALDLVEDTCRCAAKRSPMRKTMLCSRSIRRYVTV